MSKSLAAAYAMKRRAMKMANGGEMKSGYEPMPAEHEMDNHAADMEDDMVMRVMKSHKNMYSKGGMVANDVGVAEADKLPAEYDDLVLRDELESSYDGENSGDHLGDEAEDHDRADMVSRIMKSRAKRDRMPRPA